MKTITAFLSALLVLFTSGTADITISKEILVDAVVVLELINNVFEIKNHRDSDSDEDTDSE